MRLAVYFSNLHSKRRYFGVWSELIQPVQPRQPHNMLCVERLEAARAIPIDAHRFYTAKGPLTPPPPLFCRSLMAPKRTAPVGQVVAYGIIRAVTILKRVMAAKPFANNRGGLRLAERRRRRFPRRVHGQTALTCPRPSGSATRNPQSAIRNPYQESAIRIKNPYRIFFSRAVTGHFYGRAYSKSVKSVLP
jgi:hypothetical protein